MRGRLTPWAFGLALASLPVLGFVQYRWIDRVSEAEIQRETSRTELGLQRAGGALDAEVTRAQLFFTVRPEHQEAEPPEPSPPVLLTEKELLPALSSRMRQWMAEAPVPQLVHEVRLRHGDRVWVVDRAGNVTESSHTPDNLERNEFPFRPGGFSPPINGRPAVISPIGGEGFFGGGPRGGPGPPDRSGAWNAGNGGPRQRAFEGPGRDRWPGDPPAGPQHRLRYLRYVVFDPDWIRSSFVPSLVDRFIGSGALNIELKDGQRSIFRSAAGINHPEAKIRLLAVRPECLFGREDPDRPRGRQHWNVAPAQVLRMAGQDCLAAPVDGPGARWSLAAQHRPGSLAASINSFRVRSILTSAGVLACLGAAIVALWLSTQRAAELARQQVEFAMSVSHELRTPLTVMRLAGDNLAQGIATSPEQVRRYGETIRRESERLGSMLEHVLNFARAQSSDFVVRPEEVAPSVIVDGAIAASETLLKEAGFTVERQVEGNLPGISADMNLMTAALTNVVLNAVRHAASGRWVRIRAAMEPTGVNFEVSDHGPGISRKDLQRIFQPFYRGSRTGSTPGTGLGLHLVRRIAEIHGGRVAVESQPGEGTLVRISLPLTEVRS